MDAHQNRMANFLALFKEFRDANADLPNRGMLKMFAQRLDLSDRYLSHVKCGRKQIGAAVARQIELKTGKPHGWMDQQHGEGSPATPDEAMMVEQILALYRGAPGTTKRLIAEAIKAALGDADASKKH